MNRSELGADRDVLNNIVAEELVQHINLAGFVSKPTKMYLSFDQILQICALVFVILLGQSIYGYCEQLLLGRRITDLQLQSEQLIRKITSCNEKKIRDLAGSDVVQEILQSKHAKNGLGFSKYLEAVATACPRGVWLTAINVKKSDNSTTLLGKAYRPGNIMQLVSNLNRELVFSSAPLVLTKIEKSDKKIEGNKIDTKVVYDFIIQTEQIKDSDGSKT